MIRIVVARRWLMVVLVLVLGIGLSHGQDKTPQQQLADVEKEIQALNKKLDELRASFAASPAASSDDVIPSAWIKALTWRSIGPANMGGRITALSVVESDPSTYWVATAS